MVRPKRDVLDIMVSILTSLAESPQKKTRLGNKTNLDSRTMNKYIRVLTTLKLVCLSKNEGSPNAHSGSFVEITPLGIQFLKDYERLGKILEIAHSQLIELKAAS